jgi:regulator of replication initiation timing
MRAKNREINIFNISLLDVLTGMLGAFLFLMLGLVPYYSKQIAGTVITEEEKRKFDELKKLLEKGLKGPLSPEEAEQLRSELNRLQSENEQLQAQNNQLQTNLNQTQQDLDQQKKDTDFWRAQDGTLSFLSTWNSSDVDVDVFVMTPKGKIYGQKTEKILGREIIVDGSDSHGSSWKTNSEGVLVFLEESGPYLVFYRIPQGASPQNYANLTGYCIYREVTSKEKNTMQFTESALNPTDSSKARPGGLYAWTAIMYDQNSRSVKLADLPSQLPQGISRLPP